MQDPRPRLAGLVPVLAALKLGLHLFVNAGTAYGFQRDEFLYFAMGRHLQLWRMDFPPAIALLAEAVRSTLGDSIVVLRLIPALAGTAVLVLAALTARELGGARWAQSLAALGILTSPLFLRSSNLFQPVVLDQLAWTVALYALARLCRDERPRWWMLMGVALGLGLLAKFSAGFIGLALLLALLITSRRAWLLTPWPWLAAGVALAIGSPSIVGQIRLGFPVLGQMADLRASQLERVTPAAYIGGQLRWGPAVIVGWIGLGMLLFGGRLRPFRVAGWTCALAWLLLLALHGKPYYVGPIYPFLLGAGGVALELVSRPRLGPIIRWTSAGLLVAYMGLTLPLGVPILPPERMARYARAMGLSAALRTNTGRLERLPEDYADMLGWEEQVRAVARVYRSLADAERAKAVIVGGNYGEAGALDFYGPRYGLPPAVCGSGSYWFFGPGTKPGEVLVTLGVDRDDLTRLYDDVRPAGHISSPWSVWYERDLTIYVARGPHTTLQRLWPSLAGQN